MALPVLNLLDKGWPFAASVLASAFTFGVMHSQVSDLRAAQIRTLADHDAITALSKGQEDMKTDLTDIKDTLHKIEQGR